MLTIIRTISNAYGKMLFKLYGLIFAACNEKVYECVENGQFEEAEYWQERCVECVMIRQKLLEKRLKQCGY